MLNEVLRLTKSTPFAPYCRKVETRVYEWQYVLVYANTIIHTFNSHYTDEEAKSLRSVHGTWHKVPETKRERKIDE